MTTSPHLRRYSCLAGAQTQTPRNTSLGPRQFVSSPAWSAVQSPSPISAKPSAALLHATSQATSSRLVHATDSTPHSPKLSSRTRRSRRAKPSLRPASTDGAWVEVRTSPEVAVWGGEGGGLSEGCEIMWGQVTRGASISRGWWCQDRSGRK